MAVTPEGKIKKMVKGVLAEFEDTMVAVDGFTVPLLKQFWPVPSGFGASDLDCIVCYHGHYIAIETKAPGKAPTPRQRLTIAQYIASGAIVLTIDGREGCEPLRQYLQGIKNANHR